MATDDEITRHAESMILRRMDTIDNLALGFFKGLTIINGGAIVALFALLAQGSTFANSIDARLAVCAAAAFALGLVAVMAANMLGYFAQQGFHWYEQEVLHARYQRSAGETVTDEPDDKQIDRGNRLLVVGGWLATGSLVAFLLGCGLTTAAALGAVHG